MLRKLSVILLLLVLLLPTAFANGSKETSEDGITTIKVANYALLESGYEEFWNGVKSGFEAQYPNYKIEWVTAPYGEIMSQVINMAGGGDKVDVIFGETAWVSGFYDSGLAAPIENILDESFIADFDQSILDVFRKDGKTYAIPLYVSPFILYYNTQLFEEGLAPNSPPTTYDEMLEMAEKLSKLTDANGNKVYAFGQTTASVSISGSSLTAMIYNFGGDLFSDEETLSIDNDGFRETIEMLAKLDDLGYNPQNAKLKAMRNLFALGQLAMYYDQSWGFNGVNSINPDAKNFTASASPLQGGNGTGTSTLESHCFILVDNGEEKNEAVNAFVQYVISEETLNDYIQNITPAYPARKSMANMTSVVNNGVLKGAAKSISNVKGIPFVPTLTDINLELCTLAQAVTVSDADIDKAISDFKAAANSKL